MKRDILGLYLLENIIQFYHTACQIGNRTEDILYWNPGFGFVPSPSTTMFTRLKSMTVVYITVT